MRKSVRFDFNPTILGPRSDFAAFLVVPVAIATILALLVWGIGISLDSVSPVAFFLLYVLFDHLHVYLGIGTALNFPEHTSQRKLFYIGFPAVCFAIYALLFSVEPMFFFRAFAYTSIFHFGRQQIGWMRASGRRGLSFAKHDALINDLVIYASTFGLVLYRVAVAPGAQWFLDDDLGHLPQIPAVAVLAAIVLVNLVYVGVQVRDWKAHRYFNVTKNLTWLSTVVVWGTSFVFFRAYNVVGVALIVVSHAAPFLVLTARYLKKRLDEGFQARVKGSFVQLGFTLFAAALLLATIEFALAEEWIVVPGLESFTLLAPLLATVSTYHYAIDSFFWRERYNPGCLRFREAPREEPVSSETLRRKIS